MPANPRPKRYEVDTNTINVFDSVNAHLCALVSYHAYYDNSLEFFNNELGSSRVSKIEDQTDIGMPTGYLVELPEVNVLAFAGTTNYSQLYAMLTRTNYCTLPGCGITAYCGWYWGRAARRAWQVWESTIRDYCGRKPTFFTGHSLGGAISAALLAMFNAAPQDCPHARVGYTFGSPRVGNKALNTLIGPCFNIQIGGDIVPKMPPSSTFAPANPTTSPPMLGVCNVTPFYPHGNIGFLEPGGNITVVGSAENLKPSSSSVEWDLIQGYVNQVGTASPVKAIKRPIQAFQESIENHLMEKYLKRLELAIPSKGGQKPGAFEGGQIREDKLAPDPEPFSTIINTPRTPITSTPDLGVTPRRFKSKH